MGTKHCTFAALFATALALIVVASVDAASSAPQLRITGDVKDVSGHPIRGVVIKPWSRYGLFDEESATNAGGSFDFYVKRNMPLDALLCNHPNYHIQVVGYTAGRRGHLVSVVLYPVDAKRFPDDVSAALRISYVLAEYEEAAVLALTASELSRRRISNELFNRMHIDDRLRRLEIPEDKPTRSPGSAAGWFLNARKDRTSEVFRRLRSARPFEMKMRQQRF